MKFSEDSGGVHAWVVAGAESVSRPRTLSTGALPQREQIIIKYEAALHGVPGQRIWASSVREGLFFHAPTMYYSRQAIVSLNAAWLVIKSVLGVALPGELLLGGPWPRPYGWIFSGHDVFERRWPRPGPALHQVQVLPRTLVIGLGTEVRHVDHQRIALPATARVAVPLAYLCWQVRAPVHDDVALPPLPLPDVVIDRDTAWRLHDPAEATVVGSEFRKPAGQAALRQRTVLRTIVAIHAGGVVPQGPFGAPRRRRGIVFQPLQAASSFLQVSVDSNNARRNSRSAAAIF